MLVKSEGYFSATLNLPFVTKVYLSPQINNTWSPKIPKHSPEKVSLVTHWVDWGSCGVIQGKPVTYRDELSAIGYVFCDVS